MKKWLCWLLAVLCLCALMVGCGGTDTINDTTDPTPLTKDEALAVAETHWNVKNGDRDPESGFLLTLVVTQFPTDEDPYYHIVLRRLVEADGEPSYQFRLGTIKVHSHTGEVVAVEKQ